MTISQLAEADSRKPRIDYAIVRARLEAGEFNSDLAREYGVSPSAITNGATRAGWNRRASGMHTKNLGRTLKISIEDRKRIVARVRSGVMQKFVASEFGVSRTLVCTLVSDGLHK